MYPLVDCPTILDTGLGSRHSGLELAPFVVYRVQPFTKSYCRMMVANRTTITVIIIQEILISLQGRRSAVELISSEAG